MERVLSNLQAIKKYFDMTLDEMRAEMKVLTQEDKNEMGALCREALAKQEA